MEFQKFIDFMTDLFLKENPTCLDDDFPDAFDDWLADQSVDYWLECAQEWGDMIQSKMRETLSKEIK